MQEQLRFERAIFARMKECERDEVVKNHQYSRCTDELEHRIDKFGLLMQFLVKDREKVDSA
jgi:hypothetical protein